MKFHPRKNLLRGRNHTGKTTLIRSLFETLGAKPQGNLESWDENAAGSILEYFAGICPPEYYRARAVKGQESKVLEEHRSEYKLLERAIDRFTRTMPLSGQKVNAENFFDEIAQLTKEVSELNQRQEKPRSVAVREQELLSSLDHQIRMGFAMHVVSR